MTKKSTAIKEQKMPGGKYAGPTHDLQSEFSPETLIEDTLNVHDVTLAEADEIIKERNTAPGIDLTIIDSLPEPPVVKKELKAGSPDMDTDDEFISELQDMSNKLSEVLQTTLIPIVDCIGKASDLIQEMEVKKNGYKKKYEEKCKALTKLKNFLNEI